MKRSLELNRVAPLFSFSDIHVALTVFFLPVSKGLSNPRALRPSS